MDKIERARELYELLEGKKFGTSAAEVAKRNFSIQEMLAEQTD